MDGPARIVSKIINKFDHFTEPPTRHREFGRCQPGTPVDAGRKEINVFRQLGENETFEKCSILPAPLNLFLYLTGVQVQGRRKF